MTYKHRLARRLAQSRMIGVVIAAVVAAACNGSTEAVGPSGDSAFAVAPSSPGIINSIQNSSQCIDVSGGFTKAETPLISYGCTSGPNQIFTYYPETQQLKAYNGTMCVDDQYGRGLDGDAIIIWPCTSGANQKWQFTAANEIKGINGKCIDISGGTAGNLAKLILKTCSGAASQKWNTSRLASGTTPPPSGTGEQARGADDFVNTIGVNIHLNYLGLPGADYAGIVKPRLLELGIRHVRDGMQAYPQVQDEKKDLAANGVRLMGVCVPAGWYQGARNWSSSDCTTYANQLGTSVVELVEGMNEVDLVAGSGWVNAWRTFEQALWNEIKGNSTWRSVPVVANSLAYDSNAPQIGDQSAYLDFGNMHPYPGPAMPSNGLSRNINNFRQIAGTKPLIASETGYHNAINATNYYSGVSERASGKYLSRLFFEYFNAGVYRTYLYNLIDDGTSTTDASHNWGLLRYNGTPKPQFTAIKNIIALLKDPGPAFTPGQLNYTLSGSLTNVHHTLVHKRDGRFYLVLWQEVSSFNASTKVDINVAPVAVTLQLGNSAKSVNVYRPLSSTTPIAQYTATQTVSLSVPDEALIVEMAF